MWETFNSCCTGRRHFTQIDSKNLSDTLKLSIFFSSGLGRYGILMCSWFSMWQNIYKYIYKYTQFNWKLFGLTSSLNWVRWVCQCWQLKMVFDGIHCSFSMGKLMENRNHEGTCHIRTEYGKTFDFWDVVNHKVWVCTHSPEIYTITIHRDMHRNTSIQRATLYITGWI